MDLLVQEYIENLKFAKQQYLIAKVNQNKLRDSYIASSEDKELKMKRRNERIKQRWKILKKHFGKAKLSSILAVEVKQDGIFIRVSSQF